MVTVFGILNLTEDSFFDESRRLDPAGAVTAAIEMLRVGSDVVDVGPAASHPDARPVSPADEIRRALVQRKLLISSVLPAPRFIKFLKTKGPRDTPIFIG